MPFPSTHTTPTESIDDWLSVACVHGVQILLRTVTPANVALESALLHVATLSNHIPIGTRPPRLGSLDLAAKMRVTMRCGDDPADGRVEEGADAAEVEGRWYARSPDPSSAPPPSPSPFARGKGRGTKTRGWVGRGRMLVLALVLVAAGGGAVCEAACNGRDAPTVSCQGQGLTKAPALTNSATTTV